MIEVGKKYNPHYDGKPKRDVIYECVYVSGNQFLLKRPDGSLHLSNDMELKYYSEYVEPKKGMVWVNIYGNGSWSFSTKGNADRDASRYGIGPRIACVEVPWTEGQGL